MANPISFSFLVLCLTIFFLASGVEPSVPRHSRARAYLEGQCQVTRYPKLCVECLSTYGKTTESQGPQQLAQTMLMVALAKARYTKDYVSTVAKQFNGKKARDLLAVKECLLHISNVVDQLAQSIKELQKIGHDGEENFEWHESNIQSWISTAITETTDCCIDGFSGYVVGGKAKSLIKAKVLNVAELTSNSLALFNRFTAKHRSSRAFKLP